jgi:hypothetical protein
MSIETVQKLAIRLYKAVGANELQQAAELASEIYGECIHQVGTGRDSQLRKLEKPERKYIPPLPRRIRARLTGGLPASIFDDQANWLAVRNLLSFGVGATDEVM